MTQSHHHNSKTQEAHFGSLSRPIHSDLFRNTFLVVKRLEIEGRIVMTAEV